MRIKLALICLLITFIIGFSIFFILKDKNRLSTLESSAPRPASPANSISGIISNIEENTIEITRKTSPEKTRAIRVKVDNNTTITKSLVPSYTNIHNAVSPTPFILQISDLAIGQTLIISSNQDISGDSLTEFTASEIQVLSSPYTLTGKIIDLTGDTITLSTVPDATKPDLKNYYVKIDSDTLLYKLKFTPENSVVLESEKVSLEDLEKDMQVTVYTDADVTTADQLTAAYIEIVPLPPSNPAQPIAQ